MVLCWPVKFLCKILSHMSVHIYLLVPHKFSPFLIGMAHFTNQKQLGSCTIMTWTISVHKVFQVDLDFHLHRLITSSLERGRYQQCHLLFLLINMDELKWYLVVQVDQGLSLRLFP